MLTRNLGTQFHPTTCPYRFSTYRKRPKELPGSTLNRKPSRFLALSGRGGGSDGFQPVAVGPSFPNSQQDSKREANESQDGKDPHAEGVSTNILQACS